MKFLIPVMSLSLFFSKLSGQITFSNIDVSLKVASTDNATVLTCANPEFSIKFQVKKRHIRIQDSFAIIDSQLMQIVPLKIDGYPKSLTNLSTIDQKELLESYSSYELNYYKNELNLELINPNKQLVMTKTGQWLVWYFRVGNVPVQVDKKTEIQLFATTIIGDKILTINAPIQTGSNFAKAALIVNDLMESLTINTSIPAGSSN